MTRYQEQHQIDLVHSKAGLTEGDLLFLISCSEILTESDRRAFTTTLVIHASDLPIGRGWSPHIWQILDGDTEFTLSLMEAEDKLDSGAIWKKVLITIDRDALWDEINHKIFEAELSLMDFAVLHCEGMTATPQSTEVEPTYLPKRTPLDSKIDPQKSIEEQFNLLRVCDPDRFPAYFELHGHRYSIRLEKI
jgi:methionyl-tRNA formyltransferase